MSDTAHIAPAACAGSPARRALLNLACLGLLPSWLIMGFALSLPILIVAAVSVSMSG
ncbi:hypothetical protein [Ruegeria marina]|uniref:hypothetical protein n=1 Tax=Ruegeria marina TaxID=639004 RepID=UPI0015A0F7A3|nr:hypothetical protein [Ruegeria marina]